MRAERIRRLNWQWVPIGVIVGFTVFLVLGPLLMLIFSSFRTVSPGAPGPLTFANYLQAFLDPSTYKLLLNTAGYALVALSIGLPLGLFFAWLVERTNTPFRNIGFALIPVTLAIPGMLYAICWLLLLSPNIGIVNVGLQNLLGLENPPLNPYSILGMGFVEGLRLASTVFLMTVGVFRSMDPSLEEAAITSGANVPTTMRRVTFRLMLPGILAAAIYCTTTAFDAFEIPAVMGMPKGIFVFATKIYMIIHQFPVNYGLASTLGAFLIVLAMLWVYLNGRATRRVEQYATVTGKGFRSRVIDLGRWKYVGTALLGVYFLVVVVAPVSVMFWGSLLPFYEIPSAEALSKVSLNAYRTMLTFPWLGDALKNTLMLILAAPTLAVLLSTIVAWVVVRTKLRGRRVLDALTFLPHSVPGVVMAIAFLWLYLRMPFIPIYGTIWIIVFAFSTRDLAYGTRVMNAAMIQIHKELEEASQVSGASWPTTFYRIIVPLLLPSIISTWIWSAINCVRILSIALILYSPQSRVLSVLVWDIWGMGDIPYTCAIGTMLVIFLASLLFTGRVISMRKARQF